mmetsp:Transcript_118835/g.371542  ORF Transcript_118835/g.371542 Transcript_118835/m.371542 type:complete len:404 (+) Transcript_118835:170-1381(+)
MIVPTGEWAFRASVLGNEGALSGHVFLDPAGRAAYIADGEGLVGRGVGRWIHDLSASAAALELEVYQYSASAANVPKEPHRFRGIWTLESVPGPFKGEWYFCSPAGQSSHLVGSFKAAATTQDISLTALLGEVSDADMPMVLATSRDALMAVLDSHPFVRASGSRLMPCERLVPYQVGELPTVHYIPNWVKPEQEAQFIDILDCRGDGWEEMPTRSTQEWGAGDRCSCGRGLMHNPLPKHCQCLADALHHFGVFDRALYPMNSVRIHSYRPGQGIRPHCDGPVYFPRVAILSLGSPCIFSFYPTTGTEGCMTWDQENNVPGGHDGGRPLLSLVLEPRSLLIFSDATFWHHRHGIAAVTSENVAPEVCNLQLLGHQCCIGDVVKRTRRVSLTMRHLLPRCACQD